MYDTRQQTQKTFDKPLFVIRHQADLDELRRFVASSFYDQAEWAQDRASNPLCRLGQTGSRKYPDRVATVCVRRHNFLDETTNLIQEYLSHGRRTV